MKEYKFYLIIVAMYVILIGSILAINIKPVKLLKPIEQPLNGYMFNSNYVWGCIPNK